MTENKLLWSVILVLAAAAGYDVSQDIDWDKTQYFCESRLDIDPQTCDGGFSKYVAEKGKCINIDAPNYICRTGWKEATNDLEIDVNHINYGKNRIITNCDKLNCTKVGEGN